ncbi:MAG: hypothetical protein QY316_06370 [Thermodesulfobacteriota bacterium]|nr:MAG: hypothetical protein QY316_06370 [Thermodesulfobacteriota bacterium]
MFTFKVKGLKELQEALDPEKYKKIATRTLNKLGPQARTAISREVRSEYNIKRDRFDAGLYVKRVSWEDMKFLLAFRGRPPGLQHFDARQTRKGVTVKVKKASGRKVVKKGFMANTPEGAPAIWKRTGEFPRTMTKGRYKGKMREPIERLYGPDIVAMVKTVGIRAAQKIVHEKAESLLAHEFEREIGRK